ncbi:hypothetical protein FYJ34_02595 [Clostridiaceae bacterium 68-1-5]|uniref:Uncharacterized protein n=1 Tax=Suipraeoptans intestinalis TaxID=2606628 RepID=A0A6N7V037_9FIRM|nr:hypothetical protein [Suipraeoptans intestinalis]MDY3122338.1 hypothetical protein [Suipraeoptans intestinalis]MSR93196.1 hypothetical protein [Suipraeoptans intestinalis]
MPETGSGIGRSGIGEIYKNGLKYGLWCGFYGCILLAFFSKEKIYKYAAIIMNLTVILLCTVGALMGGIYGLGIILLHMLIPFYSAIF